MKRKGKKAQAATEFAWFTSQCGSTKRKSTRESRWFQQQQQQQQSSPCKLVLEKKNNTPRVHPTPFQAPCNRDTNEMTNLCPSLASQLVTSFNGSTRFFIPIPCTWPQGWLAPKQRWVPNDRLHLIQASVFVFSFQQCH